MKKNTADNKLIDKIITSLDWDSILEVNKCFKLGVGEGSSVVPGIKRKVFSESLTKNDIKTELKTLLKYVVANDVAEMFYGPWMIFWVNGDWIKLDLDKDEDDDDQPNNPFGEVNTEVVVSFDSTLEVIYSPQRITVAGNSHHNGGVSEDSDVTRLETMLKKALDSENYELANKIKELLALQNNQETEDK
jgi:hypothetical protein